MAKFEDYGLLAEKYYVEEQLSIRLISQKLSISEKTLARWQKNGNWENKRKDFLSSQYTCSAALQELVIHLAKDANEKIKMGEMPEASALNFIGKMAEKLPKIKAFDEMLINEKLNEEKNEKDMSKKVAIAIDKKLMGN
ncbi:MAG: hypothetical protein DKM22_05625 [Candidatus Melainabacteria bacterium]|nr:MAG: hypothetical protein DKM22_05625 [Candidatus Melainabacteria bacterium]